MVKHAQVTLGTMIAAVLLTDCGSSRNVPSRVTSVGSKISSGVYSVADEASSLPAN